MTSPAALDTPRLDTRRRWWAWATLVTLLLATAWSLIVGSQVRSPSADHDPDQSDTALYAAIYDRVRDGESYYDAAVAEQYERGYPVTPATTVRLPTLTLVNVALGPTVTRIVLLVGVLVVLLMAPRRFASVTSTRGQLIASWLLLAAGLVLVTSPAGVYFAESWACVLMLSSLLVGVERRPRTALALAVAALLFRELALLYVVAIGLLQLLRGRRALACVWWGAAVVFCVAYVAVHVPHVAAAVSDLGAADARASQGWIEFGGWPLVVDFVRRATPLLLFPYAVASVAVAVAIVGWGSRRSALATEFLVATAAFSVPFLVVGRTNNAYWGLLFGAIVLPGLAFAPSALRDLGRATIMPGIRALGRRLPALPTR